MNATSETAPETLPENLPETLTDNAAPTPTNAGKTPGLTGSTLKIIAAVTMFIDHLGASPLLLYLKREGLYHFQDAEAMFGSPLMSLYTVLRLIGRISFPLYAFLLVEGARHTRSIWKYMVRLFIFGIISEIPFDLALHAKYVDWSHQNVCWTLLLGLLAIEGIRIVNEKVKNTYVCAVLRVLIACALAAAAWFLKTDYKATGVLTIVLMYLFIDNYTYAMTFSSLLLTLSNQIEISAFAVVPLVAKYNGKRGLKNKAFFYAFYPAHFLFYAVICHLLGLLDLTKWNF